MASSRLRPEPLRTSDPKLSRPTSLSYLGSIVGILLVGLWWGCSTGTQSRTRPSPVPKAEGPFVVRPDRGYPLTLAPDVEDSWQLASVVRKECALDTAIEEIIQATRRFAKRQEIWYRKEPNVTWYSATNLRQSREEVLALWDRLSRRGMYAESQH